MKKIIQRVAMTLFVMFVLGNVYLLVVMPKDYNDIMGMPVDGGTSKDYNPKSFWHPWGDHNHRGIDIFAPIGTKVRPARSGVVIWTGSGHNGGKNILILDNHLYMTYYAHLSEIDTHIGAPVDTDDLIGKVEDTGNAKGKPSHLHLSETRIIKSDRLGKRQEYDNKYHLYFTDPATELSL